MKRGWIKYAAALLAGAAAVCAILFGKAYFGLETAKERLRVLSDAFLVPGLVLILAGCMVWIVRQGTFSGMGYTVRKIWNSLHSKEYQDGHRESYAEYRERKSAKRTPFLFLILTGAFYLLPSIVITVIYATL